MSHSYTIAGITFAVEGSAEQSLLQQLKGFSVFRSHSPQPDFSVRFGCTLPTPSTAPFHIFDFTEAGLQCALTLHNGIYHFSMHKGSRQVFLMRHSCPDCFEATSLDNLSLLRFAMWMAFSLFSLPKRISPIHASAIVHKGRAVLFLGESGTGKSTHTRLWLNHIEHSALLNDDSPVLSLSGATPMLCGSPWSGKTHCYHNAQFPLAAVVRLSQAPANSMVQLPTIQAFSALQPSLPPALARDEHYIDHIVSIVSSTIAAVPVFHLACLPDSSAALLCCNTIFNRNSVN